MPVKRVQVDQLGEVILARRRGVKNLRLSVNARGQVRVSMPYWSPYSIGVEFARSRTQWLQKQLAAYQPKPLLAGAKIGHFHQIWFQTDKNATPVKISVKDGLISVRSALPITDPLVQQKLHKACESALRSEALEFLPQRTKELAAQHNFHYRELRVRKLVSRWGSCSHQKDITLSYYLMQLPDDLIDYVIIHELIHIKHLHHGPDFWRAFTVVLPNARQQQKAIRSHHSRLEPR